MHGRFSLQSRALRGDGGDLVSVCLLDKGLEEGEEFSFSFSFLSSLCG